MSVIGSAVDPASSRPKNLVNTGASIPKTTRSPIASAIRTPRPTAVTLLITKLF
jgi:hypothetical protein